MTADDEVRSMLLARAARSRLTDSSALVSGALARPRTRAVPVGGLAGALTVLVIVLGASTLLRPGVGGTARPVGLWQSDGSVGTGAVGSEMCVALELSDAAYRDGTVTIWWWLRGESGCRTSESGPMASSASLTPVQLPAGGSRATRPGYAVSMTLALLPAGEETVRFLLDPTIDLAGNSHVSALRGEAGTEGEVAFRLVQRLDVAPPDGLPVPTPVIAK